MADVKISELTAQASANVDVSADVLALVDTSATQTKKISVENLLSPITIDKSAGTITSLGTIAGDVNVTADGARFFVSSADYELVSIGRAGSSGASLDQGYLRMKSAGSNKLALHTAGDSYFNGGSVGIGTDSPDSILHIKGGADWRPIFKIENTSTGNESGILQFHKVASDSSEADNDYLGGIEFHGINSNNDSHRFAYMYGISSDVTDGTEDGRIDFMTAKAGTDTITMTLKSGNVGIGTTSPAVTTHIHSDAETFAYVTTDSDVHDTGIWFGHDIDGTAAYTGIVYDRDVYKLKLFNANSIANHLVIDNEGKVGVGVESPNTNSKLHIRQASSGQTSSSNNTQLTVENSGSAGIQILTGTTNVGGIWVGDSNGSEAGGKLYYNNNDDAWSFYNAGSVNSLSLNSNGSASFAAAISTPKGVGYVVHNVTVGPGSTSTYNLNGMGGNCAIGLYAAACMREGNTTANNTTHIGVHQHTQGSNTDSDLLTRTDNSDSTIVRSGGNLTCTNNETGVNLKFIVKYFNLIALDTSNNLA